jgi:hypothetical protein
VKRDAYGLDERAVCGSEQVFDETVERALAPVDAIEALRAPAPRYFRGERVGQAPEPNEIVPPFAGDTRDHAARDRRIERKVGPESGQRVRSLTA